MQITALNFSSIVTAPSTSSNKAVSYGTDQAQLGMSAEDLNQYIQEAKQEPEVRDNLVQHFQNQIKNGSYPSPSTMSGLTAVIAGGLSPLDKVAGGSQPS